MCSLKDSSSTRRRARSGCTKINITWQAAAFATTRPAPLALRQSDTCNKATNRSRRNHRNRSRSLKGTVSRTTRKRAAAKNAFKQPSAPRSRRTSERKHRNWKLPPLGMVQSTEPQRLLREPSPGAPIPAQPKRESSPEPKRG